MNKVKGIALALCVGALCGVSAAQNFEDVSNISGFDAQGKNNGIAVGDYDNDGYEDIYISRKEGRNLLYRNSRTGQFIESAGPAGVDYDGESNSSVFVDIDNDGDLDLFVGNYREPCKLYRNDGGQFTDIAPESGIYVNGRVVSVNAIDFDLDGDLDIYIALFNEKNILYRNDDGHFKDVATDLGLTKAHPSMAAIFFDFDNDGDPDLYQVNDAHVPNELYENTGQGFRDVSEFSGTDYAGFGMGVDIADLDNDGFLDLYITNLYDNILYRNKGDGTFQNLSSVSRTADRGMGWGTMLFDCNNDGLRDIYLGNDTDFGVDGQKLPNRLFENLGGFIFHPHGEELTISSINSTYGTAFLDYDNDGGLDIALANYKDGNQLFRNSRTENRYISFSLKGTQSNSQGIGVRAHLYTNMGTYMDYTTCGSGYASQSSARLHFGLNEDETVDSLVVYWPSGIKQSIEGIEEIALNEIIESQGINPPGLVVWTDPPFPTQFDDVTVYFDASEGNGALKGYDGLVFAHTGVITSKSSSSTDWQHVIGNWGTFDSRVIMENEGEDIYSISYNINDFYNVSPGEEVYQMAFVFRNQDGSLVGRDTDGSDIFTDVFPPDASLHATILSPLDQQTVLFSGDSLHVQIQVNRQAWVTIEDNNMEVFADSTAFVDFFINDLTFGPHRLDISVRNGSDSIMLHREYLVLNANAERENPPAGIQNGLNYHTDSTLVFSLFAPGKDFVFLLTPENGYSVDPEFLMFQSEDGQTFWIELPRAIFENGQATYQYLVDGSIAIADPYSEVILDPGDDAWIDADVLAELPPYPEGMAAGIVTAFDVYESEFSWEANDFTPPEKSDLIIYELLIRDFLEDHSYSSLIDTLDYLENLGINAIELMPVFEFEGNISWGYNPSFHLAVDKYYGSRDQLKKFIDEAHKRGMAVILDVVFNHVFSQSPLARLYWDAASFRPTPENPWLNVEAKHPFNVGYDVNHESEATKEWVKQNLHQWIEKYRFDGFRFDLSKGFTQRNYGNDVGAWGQYDASRVRILKEYADYIWSLDPDNYVILEHFADNSEERELADYGMMIWGNITHEFAEAAMGYPSDLDWADYTERGYRDPHLIAYMESHDEERMMYKLEQYGDRNSMYDTRNQETALDRVAAASAIFYTIPGPKMLWQFGELGYDFPINYCPDGTIMENCRVDPKPIRWDYLENEHRTELYNILSNIFHLKTHYPTFSTQDFNFNDGNFYLKTVHLYHPDMDAISMANFRIVESSINPKFPNEGIWYEYFTGDSLIVTDTQEKLDFGPGEYRIYTSERITPPNGFVTGTAYAESFTPVEIFPNPVQAGTQIRLKGEFGPEIVEQALISDINGKIYKVDIQVRQNEIELNLPYELTPGYYVLRLYERSGTRHAGEFIIQNK